MQFGPGHAHAGSLGESNQCVLTRGAFGVIGFRVARGIDDRAFDAGGVAAFKIGQRILGGEGEDRQIDFFRHGFDVRITDAPADLGVLWIDRIQLLKAGADQQIDGDAANARGHGGGADDGDRFWFQQRVEAHASRTSWRRAPA